MKTWAWCYSVPGKTNFDATGPWSLGYIYDQMEAEGLLPVFFYDGVPTRPAFIGMGFGLTDLVYAAYIDVTPLVFARVNNLTGLSGLMHFCYFEAGMPHAADLAFDFFDFLRDGGMKSLLGLTPKPYRHAINFAVSVGFERIGVLPGACYLAARCKHVDGILTVKNLNKEN